MKIPLDYGLTPNLNHRQSIERVMKSNGGYCPCVPERNEDTKCLCKKFRETGECCCNYIVKI
jgi:hypothetical protein